MDIGKQEQKREIIDIKIFKNSEIQTITSLGKNCTLSLLHAHLVNKDKVDLLKKIQLILNNSKVNKLNKSSSIILKWQKGYGGTIAYIHCLL